MTKDELRQQMRERRHGVSQEDRRAAGKDICGKVIGRPLSLLTRAWRVCVYLSTKNEIPTRYIARAMWEASREVCVPAWSTSENAYKLYAIDPHMRLITGHHGIREPAVHIPVMPWDIDAFILPGLVFDTCGGRLGYGAGHYDQILGKAAKTAQKIAICYDWQISDDPVPQGPLDIAMDWIVTDKRVINCIANRSPVPANT